MGFWDKVKKEVGTAASQLDFWDKEENSAQLRGRPYVPPARPANLAPPPKQTFWDRVTDVVDQNSAMDKYRAKAKERDPVYAASQRDLFSTAGDALDTTRNVGKMFAEGFSESPKALGEAAAFAFSPEVKKAEDALQSNMDTTNEILRKTELDLKNPNLDPHTRARKEALRQKMTDEASRTYNAVSEYKAEKDAATDPKRVAAATADVAFTIATAGVGSAGVTGVKTAAKVGAQQAIKQGAKQASLAAKTAAVKAGAKELAKQSAKSAAVSAPSGGFGTAVVNPDATAGDIAMGTLAGGAVGAALPAAGLIAAPVVKAAGRKIAGVVDNGAGRTVKVTRAAANKTADAANTVQYRTTPAFLRDIDAQIEDYRRAFNAETNPKLRKEIGVGLAERYAERRRLTQGGYLGGEKAKTFEARPREGVFESPSGRRFEGSDENIKITGLADRTTRTTTIGELFEHDELFNDYPQLRNMPIKMSRDLKPHQYGGYNPTTKTMVLNRNLSPNDKLTTIMHELNHAIDDFEGFQGGGNPNHPKLDAIMKEYMDKGLVQDGRKIRSLGREVTDIQKELVDGNLTAAKKAAARKKIAKLTKEIQTEQAKPTEQRARFDAYEALYGETTSRTVENRLGMSDADRARRPFMADLDTKNPKKLLVETPNDTAWGTAVETDVTPMIPDVSPDAPAAGQTWVHPTVKPGAPLPGGKKAGTGRPRSKKPDYRSPEVTTDTPPLYDAVEVENGLRTQINTAFVDKDAPLLKTLRRMEKASGQTGLVDRFLYDSGLQSRANSIANYKMATSEQLQRAMRGLGTEQLDEFNKYAGARAELTMANRGMKTSRPKETLEAIVGEFDDQYGERFTALNQFYKERAKDLYDAGIIDSKKYNDFISSDDYVRIQRDFDDLVGRTSGTGNSYSFGRSLTSLKRKGSERELLPTDQVTFEYTQQIQKEIQRNQTATNLIDTLQQFGMVRKLTTKQAVNKNTIKRIVNGKVERYEIDPILKDTIDNIRPYQLNGLERIIGAPARIFRAGTTALSAPFSAANYLRDQAGSAVNSTDVMATHIRHPQNMFTSLWEAGKDFGIGNNNDELWKKFIAHAGDTTQYDMTRNVRDTRTLSRELRMGQKGRAANAVLAPIRTLEDLNAITEKATRFQNFKGVYEKVLKDTNDPDLAIQRATVAAWQNSIDFNRAGNIGRFMNLLIPYFNAGIQGTRQMGRSFTRSPKSAVATTAKAIGIVGMPLYAATAWNMMDEDRREIYNNLSDFEKENSMVFILPWTEQNEQGSYNVLKFPLPPGYKDIIMPGRRAMESFANQNPQEWGEMANDFMQAVAGPLQVESFEKAGASLIPQAVKPLVQQKANQDFFTGKPIVQDYIEDATDAEGNPIPEAQKAQDWNSDTVRYAAGKLGVSPIRAEKFLKDTFGAVGQYSINTIDRAIAATQGDNPITTGNESDWVIGGRSGAADIKRRFTEASGEVNYKASEGSKYFKDVTEVLQNRTGNTKNRWEAIHPSKSNFLGDEINQKSIVDSGVKAGVYLQDPEVFEIDRELDKRARDRGKPGNPLFDLPVDQRQTILSLQANKNFNPGDKAMPDVIEKQNPWIKDYYKKQSDYFDKIAAGGGGGKGTDGKSPNGIPKPEASEDVQRMFDVAGQITDPAMKAQFYKENPELTEYLEQNEQYNRAKRAYLGLPQLDRFPNNPQMKALEEQYFAIEGKAARKAFMAANPGLSDYWLEKNLWQLNEAGARARFEGETLDEDAVKDIQSIARSLGSKGGYGGGGGGGDGYVRTGDVGSGVKAPEFRKPQVKGVVKVTRNKSTPGKITVKRGGRI